MVYKPIHLARFESLPAPNILQRCGVLASGKRRLSLQLDNGNSVMIADIESLRRAGWGILPPLLTLSLGNEVSVNKAIEFKRRPTLKPSGL